MKTCVFCISKLAYDINDFCEHYLSLGFDHIFIVDNNDYDKRYKIDDERITTYYYPSEFKMQNMCKSYGWLQDSATKIGLQIIFNQEYDYCFICDDDEYLDLKGNYSNVKDFLSKYSDYNSLSIRWEIMDDNNYIYIKDEPKNKKFREIYNHSSIICDECEGTCKSFYKFPKEFWEFKNDIFGDKPYIFHSVTDNNHIYINPDEITIKHYYTLSLERFILKKCGYKGNYVSLDNKYLEYFSNYNYMTTEKLKAYVDLCSKYNIILSDNDMKILTDNGISTEERKTSYTNNEKKNYYSISSELIQQMNSKNISLELIYTINNDDSNIKILYADKSVIPTFYIESTKISDKINPVEMFHTNIGSNLITNVTFDEDTINNIIERGLYISSTGITLEEVNVKY